MPRVNVSITDDEMSVLRQVSDLTGYSNASVLAIFLGGYLTEQGMRDVVSAVLDADSDDSVQLSLDGLLDDGRRRKRRR